MSARDDVLDHLETALTAITTDNGYYTTVKKVARGPLPYEEIANNCPFIAIIEGDETPLVTDATQIRFRSSVGLVLYVKGPNLLDMSKLINELADDVKTMIYTPVDLGDNGFSAAIMSSDIQISLTEKVAAGIMEIEVIYYADIPTF